MRPPLSKAQVTQKQAGPIPYQGQNHPSFLAKDIRPQGIEIQKGGGEWDGHNPPVCTTLKNAGRRPAPTGQNPHCRVARPQASGPPMCTRHPPRPTGSKLPSLSQGWCPEWGRSQQIPAEPTTHVRKQPPPRAGCRNQGCRAAGPPCTVTPPCHLVPALLHTSPGGRVA